LPRDSFPKGCLKTPRKIEKYEAPQAPLWKNGGGMQRRRRCRTENYANETPKGDGTGKCGNQSRVIASQLDLV